MGFTIDRTLTSQEKRKLGLSASRFCDRYDVLCFVGAEPVVAACLTDDQALSETERVTSAPDADARLRRLWKALKRRVLGTPRADLYRAPTGQWLVGKHDD